MAVTPEGSRPRDGLLNIINRCRVSLMRARAGRRCEDGREPEDNVDLQPTVWKGAEFWLDPDPAISANVFKISRKLLVADLYFDRAGVEVIAIRPLAPTAEEVSVAGEPTYAEVKAALGAFIAAGLGQVAAIKALDVHFAGRSLPSRDGYLRPWAAKFSEEQGRNPSKPGPFTD